MSEQPMAPMGVVSDDGSAAASSPSAAFSSGLPPTSSGGGSSSSSPSKGAAAATSPLSKLSEFQARLQKQAEYYELPRIFNHISRGLVALYFFNMAYTGLEIWWFYRQPYPWTAVPVLIASILVLCDVRLLYSGGFLAIVALFDTLRITYNQLQVWHYHGHLYINELMAKKAGLLGATALMVAQRWQSDYKGTSSTVAGLLLSAKKQFSNKKSIVLLIGRLLMSSLFLYVGVTEIKRQMDSVVEHDGHVHRRRAPGDGHDNMWPKVAEFVLSLPLIIGFRSILVSRLIAIVLILEAFIYWSWWNTQLNVGYKIHAREHHVVCLGVAGGLMLLSFVGAGKYTVDELLKKRE